METLKRILPFSGPEGVQELKNIATRFEEKIYSSATSQNDYLRKISLKMLTMESKSQNTLPLPSTSGGGGVCRISQDPVSAQNMQSQVHNQGQSVPLPMVPNQPQARQLLAQNIQNNSVPSVSGLTQNPASNAQRQHMQQIASRQQPQQSQTPQQFMHSQQLQNQMTKQRLQSQNIQQSLGQTPVQPQPMMQTPSVMQPSMNSGLQLNQPSVQQQPQSVLPHQQSVLRQQQQQQQQNGFPNVSSQQQNSHQSLQHFMGQQASISDLHQQLSHQTSMQTNQHPVLMMQHPKVATQPQSQSQSRLHTQLPQVQKRLGLQQQSNSLQHDMQQRIHNSNALLQHQASLDSTAQNDGAIANTGDWKEDVYQRIKVLKDSYLAELSEMYQKISMKLQHNESLTQQPKAEQLEKLRMIKHLLAKCIAFIQVQKNNVTPVHRDKLASLEKQIIGLLNSQNRSRKPSPSMQQTQMQSQSLESGSMASLQSQSGVNLFQQSVNPQSDSNMLQNQHLKQQKNQVFQAQQSGQPQQHILQKQLEQQQPLFQQQIDQMNDVNELKMRQGLSGRSGGLPQHLSLTQHHQLLQASSPMPCEPKTALVSSLSNTANLGHEQMNNPPAADGTHDNVSHKSSEIEQPVQRLIKAVKSVSPKALNASVRDIGSVVSMIDRIAGSAPGNGSRATVGEDLVAMTKYCLQTGNLLTHDGTVGTKRMRRYIRATPFNFSSSDSLKQFTGSEMLELESTEASSIKKAKIEINHDLIEEIREINDHLIDTVVNISHEDVDQSVAAATTIGSEGTIIKCCFSAISLSPNLKSQYTSALMSPIQPLRMLVPTNYPNCSPILLDKLPFEVSKEYKDLSVKAKSRFNICLRNLSQPMSLGEIARTWDNCARAIISEYAQQNGGGTFSSKYGAWENCLSAA